MHKNVLFHLALTVFFALTVLHASLPVFSQEEPSDAAAVQPQTSDTVYYVQVRVIFSGKTGIIGTVPHDLHDMRDVLKTSFRYPSYELTNTIRLSVFGEESATALVFPNHYLRILSKGKSRSSDGFKLKAEIFEVTEKINEERIHTHGDINIDGIKQETEGSHDRVFPVVSSAMVLTPSNWEAIGGIPVRVTTGGRVSGNSLSTSGFGSSTPSGQEKFLILGLKLERAVE